MRAAKIASIVRVSASCQGGRRTPNTASSRPQSSRESGGRLARVGQSAVAIGTTLGAARPWRDAMAKISVASPCHVVSPVPAA